MLQIVYELRTHLDLGAQMNDERATNLYVARNRPDASSLFQPTMLEYDM